MLSLFIKKNIKIKYFIIFFYLLLSASNKEPSLLSLDKISLCELRFLKQENNRIILKVLFEINPIKGLFYILDLKNTKMFVGLTAMIQEKNLQKQNCHSYPHEFLLILLEKILNKSNQYKFQKIQMADIQRVIPLEKIQHSLIKLKQEDSIEKK